VQTNSLLALGIHYEANLFVGLILLLALHIALERDFAKAHWLALGVACGFGFYFSYQCALTIAVALAALMLRCGAKRWLEPAGSRSERPSASRPSP
jgi:threonine/homoserine/homoserine lactone efflux protein